MQSGQQFDKSYTDDWDEEQPEPARVERAPEVATTQTPPTAPSDEHVQQCAPDTPASASLEAGQESRQSATCAATRTPFKRAEEPWKFPVVIGRSALFRVGRGRGGDIALAEVPCYQASYALRYEGPRLSMKHKRVWELVIEAMREHGWAGEPFRVSLTAIAKRLGGTGTGAELKAVESILRKLCQARVDFVKIRGVDRGSAKLLETIGKPAGAKHWEASVAPELLALFEFDLRFPVNVARREKLSSELAMWLHDFLSTHDRWDKPFKVKKLQELCGYDGAKSHFPSLLGGAMEDLGKNAPDLVAGFEIMRLGRDAKGWLLRVEQAAQKAAYAMEEGELAERLRARANRAQAPSSSAPRRPRPKGRGARGGVAL